MLPKDIFREYDIRGIPGENFTFDDAYNIARAFCQRITAQQPVVCLGRDGRLSSPELADAVSRGITDSGVDVVDIGVCPTPMLYCAAHTLQSSAAIMVTGSHNPPSHNGMKCMLAGKPFFGEDIRALHPVAEAAEFADGAKGRVQHKDVMAAYVDTLCQAFTYNTGLKVAWDAGNGAAGEVMSQICQRLPGEHTTLNATIDGTFPAHHPDPSVADNLRQLVQEVISEGCALGIAFDGDGDRIGVVDDTGQVIWPDELMILYSRAVLARHPGSMIIADVKSSAGLFAAIEESGGQPLMWKTGHSHIKAKLAQTGAKLAGEMSGHIFFADDYYGYDDALYAAVRLLDIVARMNMPLSQWRTQLPHYVSTPEIRFDCPEERKFQVIDEVQARMRQAGMAFSDVDGIRRNDEQGWWLLRASNTQPVLVARAEATTQEALDKLLEELKTQLTASHINLPSAA